MTSSIKPILVSSTTCDRFHHNYSPPKSTKSQNSDSSVQIQLGPSFPHEFVPQYTEESEFLDTVDFGGV